MSLFAGKYQFFLRIVLLCCFILKAASLVLWGSSHISHPLFDETTSGVLTCDLIDNQVRAPIFAYQYELYSGDSLLESLLLVPLFKLCGRSLLSLKLFSLLSAFLTMLLWAAFIKRYSGSGASLLFLLLFLFSPPMFTRLNCMGTVASHHLINPLIAAQLIILFRIVEADTQDTHAWLWTGFGLLAGIGSYLFYTYLLKHHSLNLKKLILRIIQEKANSLPLQ